MARPRIGIVTPAGAQANNGNWRTAWRWARMLAGRYEVRVLPGWTGQPLDLLIGLHARRSADSIDAWHRAREGSARAQMRPGLRPDGAPRMVAPLVVVLTGTDLYRDIVTDAKARRSLEQADALIVLQDQGHLALPTRLRSKVQVVYASGARRRTLRNKTRRHLRALMVAHLREEKDPGTLLEAAGRLGDCAGIRIDLVGRALDRKLASAARATARECRFFRWLGGLDHEDSLRRIQRAHLLISCSRIEGGAHVVMEAIRCGTPVLASRIPGNLGMLGADYAGYFEPGDSAALAGLLQRCRDDPRMLAKLARQCRAREPVFAPPRERRAVLALVSRLLVRAH